MKCSGHGESTNREQLTSWLRLQAATLPSIHISARVQEFLLAEAGRQDARVGLKSGVSLAIHMGSNCDETRNSSGPRISGPATRERVNVGRVGTIFDGGHLQDQGLHVEELPAFFARRLRESFQVSLRERHRAKMVQDEQAKIRVWSCSDRLRGTGAVVRGELCHRDEFARGHWSKIMNDVLRNCPHQARPRVDRSELEEQVRRGKAAQARVHCGQVYVSSRTQPRCKSCLKLDAKLFANWLRSAFSGSPGPGGCSNEMLRVCSDDHEALLLLTSVAEDFARASVPESIFNCFTMASMTASEGGIRGIATSTSFRLVAKTMAKQFMKDVEQACAPFQFALSTRAGGYRLCGACRPGGHGS